MSRQQGLTNVRSTPAWSASERTRAAVLSAPGVAQVLGAPRRAPAPGEIEVRLEGCGVCGSNIPVWEGRPWFSYPLLPGQPGHEGWGVVARVGADVSTLRVGDRVSILSDRAFASHDVTSAARAVALPAQASGVDFPGEPLGCAMNAFRRSRIEAGDTVAVVGVGFLGAILTALAARAGARVIAISRRPFALDVAMQMGADRTLPLDDPHAALSSVEALTSGALCDVVIEAAGVQSTLDVATPLTRVRGRLVIAGYHQDGARTVDMQMWNWRGLDVINAHEREDGEYMRGMREAVDEVFTRGLPLGSLLTHVLPLDELDRALDLARTRPDGFLKAVVKP